MGPKCTGGGQEAPQITNRASNQFSFLLSLLLLFSLLLLLQAFGIFKASAIELKGFFSWYLNLKIEKQNSQEVMNAKTWATAPRKLL